MVFFYSPQAFLLCAEAGLMAAWDAADAGQLREFEILELKYR